MPTLWPRSHPAELENKDIDVEIVRLLNSMSMAQKVGQMIQPEIRYITPAEAAEYHIGSILSGGGAQPHGIHRASVEDWVSLADDFYEASLNAAAVLPILWGVDALHGHNNLCGATLFPHNIGLGATRNPELAREIAEATAAEIAVTGLEWTFAPTLAVTRDDRWGRTYESFAETPELVKAFTRPVVEGLQGKLSDQHFLCDPRVIATAKHYLGDGGTNDGIDQGNTLCDEQSLYEVHGQGYAEAIEAGVQTVMVSFSSWNGEKMHGHYYLLQKVLKDSMGFDGFVISDWNGHGQLSQSSNVSGDEAINAGIDMLMAPEDWRGLWHNTIQQVESGAIPVTRIDDAVSRILRVKLRAKLRFPNKPSERPLAGKADLVGCEKHRLLAQKAVRESAVLLKNNDGTLPLQPGAKILVTGPGANSISMQSGGWSLSWQGDGVTNEDFPGSTTVFSAIEVAAKEINSTAVLSSDCGDAGDYDVAIVVFGEEPYAEGPGDRQHLSYSSSKPADLALLRRLQNKGIKTVSLFLSGRPLWVNPELNASDAFLAAWLPGSEAAGLADLLFSHREFDFVGKLSFSWPASPLQTVVNLGDKEYDPLFPFGFGLKLMDSVDLSNDLDETDETIIEAPVDNLSIFDLRPVTPFKFYAGDQGEWRSPVEGRIFLSKNHVIEVHVVDWRRQEDARRICWRGGAGQVFFATEDSLDCSRLVVPGSVLCLTLSLHKHPEQQVFLRQDSGYPNKAELDIADRLMSLPLGKWQTIEFDLCALNNSGFQPEKLMTPFLLWTEGELELSIGSIRIESANNATTA
jgi:beta-glucosidase